MEWFGSAHGYRETIVQRTNRILCSLTTDGCCLECFDMFRSYNMMLLTEAVLSAVCSYDMFRRNW